MKIFLDERCLSAIQLGPLLKRWREIADFATDRAIGVSLLLDRNAVNAGGVLHRLNALTQDLRTLYLPMLFGDDLVKDWRPIAIAGGTICQLATEENSVTDCAVCETYHHSVAGAKVGLFGDEHSSYVNHSDVGIRNLGAGGAVVEIPCGKAIIDFERIALAWGCLSISYGAAAIRPPRDRETILGRDRQRFERVGRFERNGRRTVYREVQTDRLFYVDNFHYGLAAHLEVFDSTESHVGTADLEGKVDVTACVPGRKIAW